MHVTFLFFWLVRAAQADWSPSRGQQRAYSDAVVALNADEVDQAEAMFRLVLRADPACGLARHGLGLALLRQNQPEAARAVFSEIAREFPEQPDAHVGVSLAAFAGQDFSAAQSAAQQAVRLAPDSLEAVNALVSALLRQGAVGDARQVVSGAQGHIDGPSLACLEAQVLLEAGDDAAAQQRLSYCRQSLHPALSAAVSAQLGANSATSAAGAVGADRLSQLSRAVELVNAGRAADAMATLDAIVAEDGRRADVRLIRARARHHLGDLDGARSDLEAAFAGGTWVDVHRSGAMSGILRQSHAEALQEAIADGAALLVQIHIEAGELEQAAQRLAAAQQELGESTPLALAAARLAHARGDTAAAWEAALQRSDTDAGRDLLGEWAIARPDAVPDAAAEALLASPRWSDRYNLAVSRYTNKAYAGCLQAIDQAREVTLDPADLQVLWGLGYRCAVYQGDLEAADRMHALLRRAPTREADRVNHARMRYQDGRPEDALALLARLEEPAVQPIAAAIAVRAHADLQQWTDAVDRAPAAPAQERYWLGTRLAQAGQLSSARRVLTSACGQLDPEADARCAQLLAQLGGPL